jgi:membrane protein implicated in regulation of membrane protease activity
MSVTALWLLAGALFIGIEIFGVPGIGFLFAGIAALLVGGAVELGLIFPENLLFQSALFFLLTSVSAMLLWKKLKQMRGPAYSNMVGTQAEVIGGGLSGLREGQVKWSGTIMRARLADEVVIDVLPSGTFVTISKVEGTLLHVIPKN